MDLRVGYIFKNRVREGCLRSWQQQDGGGRVRASPVSIKKKGTMAQRVHLAWLSNGQSCRAHVSNDLEQ